MSVGVGGAWGKGHVITHTTHGLPCCCNVLPSTPVPHTAVLGHTRPLPLATTDGRRRDDWDDHNLARAAFETLTALTSAAASDATPLLEPLMPAVVELLRRGVAMAEAGDSSGREMLALPLALLWVSLNRRQAERTPTLPACLPVALTPRRTHRCMRCCAHVAARARAVAAALWVRAWGRGRGSHHVCQSPFVHGTPTPPLRAQGIARRAPSLVRAHGAATTALLVQVLQTVELDGDATLREEALLAVGCLAQGASVCSPTAWALLYTCMPLCGLRVDTERTRAHARAARAQARHVWPPCYAASLPSPLGPGTRAPPPPHTHTLSCGRGLRALRAHAATRSATWPSG